ncbi:hypothetical protein PGB90_004897 [Kerria lacca]
MNINEASRNGLQVQESITWEELRQTRSASINSVSDKCYKLVSEAKNKCNNRIEQMNEIMSKVNESSVITRHIQKSISDIVDILKTLTNNTNELLFKLTNKFQKRFETVIKKGNSIKFKDIEEFEKIYKTDLENENELTLLIKQYFSKDYNPADVLQNRVQHSLNSESNSDEVDDSVIYDLQTLSSTINEEIYKIENIIIEILLGMKNGMTVIGNIQLSLKGNKKVLKNESKNFIRESLLQSVQIMKMFQITHDNDAEMRETSENSQSGETSAEEKNSDLVDSSEENKNEEHDEDQDLLFVRTKRKLLKLLVVATEKIKFTDVKKMDKCIFKILRNYSKILSDLNLEIIVKIIENLHLFVKLYNVTLTVMEKINVGTKEKMEEIYAEKTANTDDEYFDDIKKYFTENYLSEKMLNEVYKKIEKTIDTIKIESDFQDEIVKELISTTNNLDRDIDHMKLLTIRMLLDMEKGVKAIQKLKDKSDIRGLKYLFNFYNNTADLAQLQKIFNMINILDIDKILHREVSELISDEVVIKSHIIWETLQKTIFRKSQQFTTEIQQTVTNMEEARQVINEYVNDYNVAINKHSTRVRKILKRTITTFTTICEEVTIIMKLHKYENVEELERVLETESIRTDSETEVITQYLIEQSEIDVRDQYSLKLRDAFLNVDELKETMTQQIREITDIIITEINNIDMTVTDILNIIINETKNLNNINMDSLKNGNFSLSTESFENLAYIMQISNTLQIHEHEKPIKKIDFNTTVETDSIDKMNLAFKQAMNQIQNEESKAEEEIQKCIEENQIESRIQRTISNLREIISNSSSEMKTILNYLMREYTESLYEHFRTSGNDEFINELQDITSFEDNFSQELQIFFENKYSVYALKEFSMSLTNLMHIHNIDECKESVLNSLNTTVKNIENNMEAIRIEVRKHILEKLTFGINTIEKIKHDQTTTINDEEIEILSETYGIIQILEQHLNVDFKSDMQKIRMEINTTRDIIRQEYKSISSLNKTTTEAQVLYKVNMLDSIYNNLQNYVKNILENHSSCFMETYKFTISSIHEKKRKVASAMRDILAGINNFTVNPEYENVLRYINSESYKSSFWIQNLFRKIMQKTHNQFSLDSCEQSLQQFRILNSEVNQNVNDIEKITEYFSQNLHQSLEIIDSIKKNDINELSEIQIQNLSISIFMSQAINHTYNWNKKNIINFNDTQKLIDQEYKSAVKLIKNVKDKNKQISRINVAIKRFDNIYNNIRENAKQQFIQYASDFFATFYSIVECFKLQKNIGMLGVLEFIMQNRKHFQTSQKYKNLESFLNSENFKTMSLLTHFYENIQQNISTDDLNGTDVKNLKILMSETKQYINEIRNINEYVSSTYEECLQVLTNFKGDEETKLMEKQMNLITETIMVSTILSAIYGPDKTNTIRSLDDTLDDCDEDVIDSQISISNEFKNGINSIKTMIEEKSMKEEILKSIDRYGIIYNKLFNKIKEKLRHNSEDYINFIETIVNGEEQNNNEMKIILEKIMNDNYEHLKEEDKDYEKLLSYIESDAYTAFADIEKFYKDIQQGTDIKNDIKKSINYVERHVDYLTLITSQVNKNILELDFINKYVNQSIQRSKETLHQTENETSMSLDDEQIKILVKGIMTSKMIQSQLSYSALNYEFGFYEIQSKIGTEIENTINSIKELDDENKIHKEIHQTITQCDNIYNNLKKSISIALKEITSKFEEIYQFVNITEETENIKNILGSIQDNITDETFEEFEKYIRNIFSTSNFTVQSIFDNIKYNENSISYNTINEESIKQLEILHAEIKNFINKMDETITYINKNLHEGIRLLHLLKNGKSKLNGEQSEVLSLSFRIIKMLSSICKDENLLNEIQDSDISNFKIMINDEFKKCISLINSIVNNEVERTVTETIEKNDSIYNTIIQKIQEKIKRTTATFEEEYNLTLNKILESNNDSTVKTLQSILNEKIDSRADQTFETFKLYVNSNSYKVPLSLKDMYNSLLQNEKLSVIDIKQRNIQHLQMMDIQINEEITKLYQNSEYISKNMEKGLTVLQEIQNDTAFQLSDDQAYTLILNQNILQTLNNRNNVKQSTSGVNETYVYSETENGILEQISKSIDSVALMNNDEMIRDTISEMIKTIDNTYNTMKQNDQNNMIKNILIFDDDYKLTIKTLEQGNKNNADILKTIINKQSNFEEETIKTFEIYVNRDLYAFSTTMNIIYEKLLHISTDTPSKDIKKRYMEQLNALKIHAEEKFKIRHSFNEYFNKNLQTGLEILRQLQKDKNVKLNDNQVNNLILNQKILNIITNANNQFNNLEINEESQDILVREDDYMLNKNYISLEFSKSIETIKSIPEENKIPGVVTEMITNIDNAINKIKQKDFDKIDESRVAFDETYKLTMANVQERGMYDIQQILQNLSSKSLDLETDQSFQAFQTYITDNHDRTPTFLTTVFDKIQQSDTNVSTDNIKERTLQQLEILKTRVDDEIIKQHEIAEYVINNLQKGSKILDEVQNGYTSQLDDEQLNSLALNSKIIEILSDTKKPLNTAEESQFKFDMQIQETDYSTAKSFISQYFSKSIESIKLITDDNKISEAVTEIVTNIDDAINKIKQKDFDKIDESRVAFDETYKLTTANVQERGMYDIQQILQNLSSKSLDLETDQSFQAFQTYITDIHDRSPTFLTTVFDKIQQSDTNVSTDNIKERTLQQLEILKTRVDDEIIKQHEIAEYVINNLQKGSKILDEVQNGYTLQLDDEQLNSLALNSKIIEILSDTKKPLNTAEESQFKFDMQIQETDYSTAKSFISQYFSKSIESIKLITDDNKISEAVTEIVTNIDDAIYKIKQKDFDKIDESRVAFDETYKLTTANVQERGMYDIQQILQNLSSKSLDLETDQSFQAFQTYITDNHDRSPTFLTTVFDKIQQSDTNVSTDNIKERTLQQLEILKTRVDDEIIKQHEIAEYVINNLQKGSKILDEVQNGYTSQLDDEQLNSLALNSKIIEILSDTKKPLNTAEESQFKFDMQIQETDYSTAKSFISQYFSKSIESIKLITDDNKISEAVTEIVTNIDDAINKIKQKDFDKIDESRVAFDETYKLTTAYIHEHKNNDIIKVLQDITNNPSDFETDHDFTEFQLYVNNKYYSSSFLAKEIYYKLMQNEDEISPNIKERTLENLEKLNTEINDEIMKMHEISQYVTNNFQKNVHILQDILSGRIDNLSDEQVKQFALNQMIIQTLSNITVHLDNVDDIIIPLKNKDIDQTYYSVIQKSISEKFGDSIDAISLITDETQIEEIVVNTIDNNENLFQDLKQHMHDNMVENTFTYNENYKLTIDTVLRKNYDITEIFTKIETENLDVNNDEIFTAFKSYITSDHYNSSSLLKEMYHNLMQTDDSIPRANIKKRSIQDLQKLNKQIDDEIINMYEYIKFVNDNFQKGLKILQSIQNENMLQLNEEQIRQLILNKEILKIILEVNSPNITTNDAEQKIQDKVTSNISKSTYEDINEAKLKLDKNIKQTINENNESQLNEHSNFNESMIDFDQIHQLTEMDKNINENKILLQDITNKSSETLIANKMYNSELFVTNEQNISPSTTEGNFEKIQHEIFTKSSTEEEQLTDLNTQINDQIIKMDNNNENLQKKPGILNTIQNNNYTQQSEKEIAQIILDTNTTQSLPEKNIQSSITSTDDQNLLTAQMEIEKVIHQSMDLIRNLSDENNINQTVSESIHNLDNVINNFKKNIQNKNNKRMIEFENNYKSTINVIHKYANNNNKKILEDILKNQETKLDKEYDKFKTFINNEQYKSTSLANNLYSTQQTHNFSSTIHEKSIAQLEILNKQVNEFIKQIDETDKYANEHWLIGSQILQMIQNDENFELNDDQINELFLCNKIIQQLFENNNTSSPLENMSEATISQTITNESSMFMAETDLLPAIQTVDIESQIVPENKTISSTIKEIHSTENTYNVKNIFNEKIENNLWNFINKFKSTINVAQENLELQNTLQDILDLRNQYLLEENEEFQIFLSRAEITDYKLPFRTDKLNNLKMQISNQSQENSNIINEIERYILKNLQNGFKILEEMENNEITYDLNDEKIMQLTICINIIETIMSPNVIEIINEIPVFSDKENKIYDNKDSLRDIVKKENNNIEDYQNIAYSNLHSIITDDDKIIIKTTATSVVTKEIQEEIIEEFDEDVNSKPYQCFTTNNLTSIQKRNKYFKKISIQDLMVNWCLIEVKDDQWPYSFSDINSKSKINISNGNTLIIQEISELLHISRIITMNSIQLAKEKIKLYPKVNDMLTIFVICTEWITETLQQLSSVMREKTQKIIDPIVQHFKNNEIKLELQSALDIKFINAFKIFFSLQFSDKIDLLDILDQQYMNDECNSLQKTKDILNQKFKTLQDIMNTIYNNIDCLTSVSIDIIQRGEFSINSNQNTFSTEFKNAKELCEMFSSITEE